MKNTRTVPLPWAHNVHRLSPEENGGKLMHVVKTLCFAAVLTVAIAPGAQADEWNKKTILTFSGPVQIPGATLPAGSYVFKLADIPGNRHVVQVFDKDEQKIYTTMLAIPNERLEPTDDPVVLFSERASGSPQAIKVWFYPGNRVGNEFVYPKSQAMRIAKETNQSVLATNDDSTSPGRAGEIPESMKTAELGRFDENGTWQGDNRRVAVSGSPAAATPQTTTAGAAATPTTTPAPTTARAQDSSSANPSGRMNESGRVAGTTGAQQTPRRSLPKTASSLALFELISGLSLAGGLALRLRRRR
jgi:hypothetical protein